MVARSYDHAIRVELKFHGHGPSLTGGENFAI
uniref:Uncharacterized protein n=1 Tax=Anguilla anguilla TaxID=7936 RepID=A0A0E9Q5N4_ANGAN